MPSMSLIFLWSKQSTRGYLNQDSESESVRYLEDEQSEVLAALEVDHELLVYTVKKFSGFSVPSRDVTYQTLL